MTNPYRVFPVELTRSMFPNGSDSAAVCATIDSQRERIPTADIHIRFPGNGGPEQMYYPYVSIGARSLRTIVDSLNDILMDLETAHEEYRASLLEDWVAKQTNVPFDVLEALNGRR